MGMLCPDLMQTIFSFLPLSQVYKTATVNKEWNANMTVYLDNIPRLGLVRYSYKKDFSMITGDRRDLVTTVPLVSSFVFTVGSKNFHQPQSVSLLPSFVNPNEIKSMLSLVNWDALLVRFSVKGWRAIQSGGNVTIVNSGNPARTVLSYPISCKDMDIYIEENTLVEVYGEEETPDFLKGCVVEESPIRKLTVEERREELKKMRDGNTIFLEAGVRRLGISCASYRHRSRNWFVFYGVSTKFF